MGNSISLQNLFIIFQKFLAKIHAFRSDNTSIIELSDDEGENLIQNIPIKIQVWIVMIHISCFVKLFYLLAKLKNCT